MKLFKFRGFLTSKGFTTFSSRERGFTLIELLVVIAILGVLAAGVLVALNPQAKIDAANLAKTETFAANLQNSLSIDLVGEWTFDDGSVRDTSGYGNITTNHGAVLAPDRRGVNKAYGFDGSSSYIDAGTGANLNMDTNDFTVSVWAKAINGQAGRGIINKGGWGSIGYFISEAYSPANTYYFGVTDSGGYKPIPFAGETWGWSFIVGIKTTNHLEVWVNGVKKGNQYNGTIGSLSNPTKAFEIGRSFNPYYFNGFIDDVRIYKAALLSYQIKQLYVQGLIKHLLAFE